MTDVFAIASGYYSDYGLHCVFEREQDARAYLEAQGFEPWKDGNEDTWKDGNEDQWRRRLRPDSNYWIDDYRIERFQYFEAGEVPHAEVWR